MSDFPVSGSKQQELLAKMERVGLKESDIEEHFIRSSGPGGQHVNKTSTCVVLRHLPTGLEVRCQRERSQSLNRFLARRLLADKLEQLTLGKESEAAKTRAKVRRQKARRSRKTKAKILENKRQHSAKKQQRSYRPEKE
jgi:protein subunit release factor B